MKQNTSLTRKQDKRRTIGDQQDISTVREMEQAGFVENS